MSTASVIFIFPDSGHTPSQDIAATHGREVPKLSDLDEQALFELLGNAWLAQFRAQSGQGYYLPTAVEVGKSEFNALLPRLRDEFAQADGMDVVERVARTIRTSGTWRMPAPVIAALAIKHKITSRNANGSGVEEAAEIDHELQGQRA